MQIVLDEQEAARLKAVGYDAEPYELACMLFEEMTEYRSKWREAVGYVKGLTQEEEGYFTALCFQHAIDRFENGPDGESGDAEDDDEEVDSFLSRN